MEDFSIERFRGIQARIGDHLRSTGRYDRSIAIIPDEMFKEAISLTVQREMDVMGCTSPTRDLFFNNVTRLVSLSNAHRDIETLGRIRRNLS